MNILSIYFSGTNSAKYVNDCIKHKCDEKHKFDVLNLGNPAVDISNFVFSKYDLFIIGGPIYIEVYPNILTHFVKKYLNMVENKKIILFQCAGSENPSGIYQLYKFFYKRNNDIVGMTSFEMPNNFYMNGMFKSTESEKIFKIKEDAEYKINQLCEVIDNKKDKFCDCKLLKNRYYLGRFIYTLSNVPYLKRYAKSHFNSDNDCTGCSICKKECPTRNIEVDVKNKSISFGKNCAACMRCIHICPNGAILYKKSKIEKMNKIS